MSEKVFEKLGLGYRMTIPDRSTTFEIDRVRHSRGENSGDLTVRTKWPGARTFGDVLFNGHFNLSSARTRKELANLIDSRVPAEAEAKLDWYGFIEAFCQQVLQAEREGAPFVAVGNLPPRVAEMPLVEPVLPRGKPTILFGDGGVGKSMTAVGIGVSVALGVTVIPGLQPYGRGPVVYLDWETDEDDLDGRIKTVCAGVGTEFATFLYRFCTRSLGDMVEDIAKIVAERKAALLIIDSVGAAMGVGHEGGDPAEGAIRFFSAIRAIGTTTLCIDHVSKAVTLPGMPVKPYGSTYKVNLARSTWEMRSGTPTQDGTAHVALFHRKSNMTALHRAMGYGLHFEGGRVYWTAEDIEDPELSAQLPLADRIARALAEAGDEGLDAGTIADKAGSTRGAVASALNRNQRRFAAISRGQWILAEAEG